MSKVCWRAALLISLLVPAYAQQGNSILDLDEAFVKESLALSPSAATAQGYHEHHGVVLDELLDDNGPQGIQRQSSLYRHYLQAVRAALNTHLTDEDRYDLEVIRLQCEGGLFDLQDAQTYHHNPTAYVEMIGNAIYTPLIQNYAPERKRLEQITARIEKIPAALADARQSLSSAPPEWTRVAEAENAGNVDLIDHEIRAKVPADLKVRYDRAATAALAALHSFDVFLKNDLMQHAADWRLGAKLYTEKFKLTLATGDTPQQTLSDAEKQMISIREDMRKQALAVFPSYFPGEQAPADLNALVSRVLDKVARTHTTPENYFPEAKTDLAKAQQFVNEKKLLALPASKNLQVIPTPEFMRGIYGVGGFSAAPALEPELGAYYWITPFTPDMSAERVESKLREYNRWGLMILTIHEAMPGHYVQFEYASQVQPHWRGMLRELFSNGPYVEGWAVYATQLLIENGFDDTREMRLTFGKQMLRVVSNTILDIRLQTMGMTDQQALDLMIQQTFQEKEEAEKKLQRAKLSSCQLPTYFVGWRGWNQVRDTVRQKMGAQFGLEAFHERALKEGGIPLPLLRTALVH